jgi:hypothetical protein
MAFDTSTRNRLAKFVGEARRLLTDEFIEQLQSLYGISATGSITPIERLGHLDAEGRELAGTLRQRIAYLVSSHANARDATEAAVARLTREQAFTVVNRLAAIRMAETRGLIVESVGQQYQSRGFKVFESVAGSAIGETFDRYRCYLFCLFDELAIDLGVLFDRKSPQAMLFPREPALLALLALLDAPDLQPLWAEDETIGWIYQYYNDDAERKKMREESAAPRNSRELAVRNQFFTPRYVVEFLTDNTLGRIWYEMTQGQTALKDTCRYLVRRPNEIFLKAGESATENAASSAAEASRSLSQEELLNQPVHIPYRPLKDPREIRLLDPACGSMHFGLYAFDLFTVIYDEAWEIARSTDLTAKSVEPFAPFVAYAATFADKAAFLRDVPRLIIEHNLHGIDIDPRAAQIAGLSLWLRAQRAWHQANVKPGDRPRITRSNIVCAEPMPGDKELLREFVEQQFPVDEHLAFDFLLVRIFDRMALAGEAGSLLRVEEEIRATIAEAKKIWEQEPHHQQKTLFADHTEKSDVTQRRLDLSGITTDEFWQRAEDRIYEALAAYAEQAEGSGGFTRRLFADDAAQGFALIDLCRKRYDVAVMNPPFGLMPTEVYGYLVNNFPTSYSDLALAFMARGSEWCDANGLVGAITSRAFLNVADAEKFRRANALYHLRLLADLGIGVMDDAFVDASAQILSRTREADLCIKDARKPHDKARHLMEFHVDSAEARAFVFLQSHFEAVPKCRIAYDSGEGLGSLLSSEGCVEPVYGLARTGASTFEDDRFLRLVWECEPADLGGDRTWCWIARTTPDFCQFYHPYEIVTKWNGDGAELCERNRQVNGQVAQARQGSSHYFKPGIVFSRRSRPSIAFRVHPSGCVFSSVCGVVFPASEGTTLFLMGVLNSRFVRAAIHTLTTYSYTVGHIRAILAPRQEEHAVSKISALTARLIQAKHMCFRRFETDHFFCPHYVPREGASFEAVHKLCDSLLTKLDAQMLADEQELDLTVADLYKLNQDVDTARFRISADNIGLPRWLTKISIAQYASNAMSEGLGYVFGRWDIRYATGRRPSPELPNPFAPLPVCPPGMLQGDDGLPLSSDVGRKLRDDGEYPLDIAWDGILVDDAEHPLDIERRVHAALAVIWGASVDVIEHEACTLLGVPTLRDWFRRPAGFFGDHLKRYSKSRRQAPIYWPLSTKSGDYTLWIYYHRLNDQTLHKCLADFLDPKIAKVEKEIASLAGKSTGKAAELRDFLNQLRDLRDEIDRVIKLPWRPNLNDGVVITASPLWKLFRFSKWSKDLKACWEELEKGDYDWAHLAYAIWPGRVEKKCESDRAIAIAHGLERLCKVEPPKPKKPRGKKATS